MNDKWYYLNQIFYKIELAKHDWPILNKRYRTIDCLFKSRHVQMVEHEHNTLRKKGKVRVRK